MSTVVLRQSVIAFFVVLFRGEGLVQESATRSVLRFGLVILCLSGFDTRGRAVLSVRRWSVTPSKQLHVRYTGRVNDKATYRLLCLIQDSRYCSVGRGSLLSVQRLGGDLRRSGGGEEESKPVTAQPPSDLSLALTINPSRGRLVASAKFKSSTRSIDTSDSLVTSSTTNSQSDLDHSEPAGQIVPKTVRTNFCQQEGQQGKLAYSVQIVPEPDVAATVATNDRSTPYARHCIGPPVFCASRPTRRVRPHSRGTEDIIYPCR